MINPEEGRHVHFVPLTDNDGGRFEAGKPHAAIVTHVWSDRMVNLTVFDRNGLPVPKTSVHLQQPEDEVPAGCSYCRWMPYTVESERKKQPGGTPEPLSDGLIGVLSWLAQAKEHAVSVQQFDAACDIRALSDRLKKRGG